MALAVKKELKFGGVALGVRLGVEETEIVTVGVRVVDVGEVVTVEIDVFIEINDGAIVETGVKDSVDGAQPNNRKTVMSR